MVLIRFMLVMRESLLCIWDANTTLDCAAIDDSLTIMQRKTMLYGCTDVGIVCQYLMFSGYKM